MKRTRAEASEIDSTAMASWLVLLSRTGRGTPILDDHVMMNDSLGRVFECKTCNRQFSSFQALGGHRASHKKPRLMRGDNNLDGQSSPVKPKTHECSICGLEFAIGQALGGHMRRHRAILNDSHQHAPSFTRVDQMEVVNRSEKVVLRLDLNLTPLENYLHFFRDIGKAAPLLDCFF